MRAFSLLVSGVFGLSCMAGAEGVERIAFGSCARENLDQPIWGAVLDTRADLFVFLGDNIYADTEDMGVMREKYAMLGAKPGFAKLRQSVPLLATWDDHDYGANDAGTEFVAKRESQKAFMDFFEVPTNDPRRSRDGVYHARVFGAGGKRIQVILLDTRFFRSPLERDPSYGEGGQAYRPATGPDATILGEEQWEWLEGQFAEAADLRVLCSSIQVLPSEHRWEKWANFPDERERLLGSIAGSGAGRTVILSGDRHLAEISELRRGEEVVTVEVTSSSLTNPGGGSDEEANALRVGKNFRLPNFGLLEIGWNSGKPAVVAQIRGVDGEVVREHRMGLKSGCSDRSNRRGLDRR